MAMCFTDTRATASWRSTFFQTEPWVVQPAYSTLVGFETTMMMPDLLHIFNLGCSRDCIACILKILIKSGHIFPGANIAERFQSATTSLRSFAKSHAHCLRLKKLTKNKIQWSGKKYPEFKGSGSDAHVVSIWLEETLQPFADQFPDLCTLLWSGNRAMRVLYAAGRFLSDSERTTVRVLGRIFVDTYLKLARESLDQHELLFRVRPKTHILDHTCECRFVRNPSYYATWMDEDWLRKVSKTIQLTSSKSAQHRVLERWLLAIPLNLKRISDKPIG